MLAKYFTLLAAASVSSGTVLDSDPNTNLFARLMPIFQAEESKAVEQGSQPLLGGESTYSLEEATRRVESLVEKGIIERGKADKLLQSLNYAERVRHIASLMDGGRLVSKE